MERIILHVDVNNAFLSWSAVWLLKNGYEKDIRNRYAIIAGDETQRSSRQLLNCPLSFWQNLLIRPL